MLNTSSLNRRKVLGLGVGSLAGAVVLSACSGASAASPDKPVNLYLSILTGGQLNTKDQPTFVPSNVTVPANSTVTVQIVDFDDGTAALADGSPYGKVTGVIGNTVTSTALTMSDPNKPGAKTTYSELALKDVAHTFTISALKLNVPIPVSSTVTFSFKTDKAGTYNFQCMAPCGSDPNGMGGAMTEDGQMIGTLHVV